MGPGKISLNNFKMQSYIERFLCHVTELHLRLDYVLNTPYLLEWYQTDLSEVQLYKQEF